MVPPALLLDDPVPPAAPPAACDALAWAHPIVAEWFLTTFGSATEPQIAGWPAILRREPTLISAPTGSGKTLAAFLVAIDRLLRASLEGRLAPWTHVVYVSPLKALSNDVQKNLDAPLREIRSLALARGYLSPEIRTAVRTGDTPQKDRAAMLRHPPHILVTTPESLYMMLTAEKPRKNLARVETVIVDEVHAVADDKRGSHLALTLERLDALVTGENRLSPAAMLTGRSAPPQRIGLSATQNPIELVASFLFGNKPLGPGPSALDPRILRVGQRRTLDLAIEVPSDELSSVASTAMWTELYDKLAAFTDTHRSTLVFVNTRRLVEKISFELAERLGEDAVGAHHGSLSRALRLDAEQRLKAGEIKILVATASLELGIDIGNIDLVCQIQTTRNIAVAMQRVGRAGHWRGAIPKGRFFALTRDDLMEQAALLRKMAAGELDLLEVPEAPIDVLMQQIVAACGAEPWEEDALYALVRRAYPYRNLTRAEFDDAVRLLHTGIESSRGRYGALLLRDGVHGRLQARRGARSIAIANGGAIPDTALYAVMLQPENVQIATLDEHFAVDSSPGDVVLLGNTSWRIQRIDPAGKVLVEDAHGAPPTIPFWEGEAPQRTDILSDGLSDLRAEIDRRTSNVKPRDLQCALSDDLASTTVSSRLEPTSVGGVERPASSTGTPAGCPIHDSSIVMNGRHNSPPSRTHPDACNTQHRTSNPEHPHDPHHQLLDALAWLRNNCFVSHSAALQMIAYIVTGRAVLGAVPTKTTLIAERFFDEGGGQQLILHAPFGGRLNKAWGLALRKRFCRGFNFELQAAATDNGINISLAEQHSFPLADVFRFLSVHTARELLEQAAILNPLFKNRWRWAAGRSLQLLRMSKGKRIAPQIQRTRSDDLLASVFPHASACPETMSGDIEIPDHPLVREVMKDTLTEAMDIEGLEALLAGIESGAIQCLAVDTPVPSLFAHELLNAMPYAYLDEAGLEERRARTVATRRTLPDNIAEGNGLLDPAAIAQVREELVPDLRDEHELHDLLLQLVALPLGPWSSTLGPAASTRHWPHYFAQLAAQGRAFEITLADQPFWIAAERFEEARLLWPQLAELNLPAPPAPHQDFIVSGTEYREETRFGPRASAALALTQGWLQVLGPVTATSLGNLVHLEPALLHQCLLAMELQGLALRGVFEAQGSAVSSRPEPASLTTDVSSRPEPASVGAVERPASPDFTDPEWHTEWCERRILQRIHRLTLGTLRKQIEPVSAATLLEWLAHWQHVAPQTQPQAPQLQGEEGVLAAIEQLEGFEAPAIEWERTLLPARVAHYDPAWLDNLCLAGVVGWGRISPHPAWTQDGEAPRRVIPTSAAPITFFLREDAAWLHHALAEKCVDEAVLTQSLSPPAQAVRTLLSERGAAFTADLQRLAGLTKLETTTALWELATAGLASADGFDQMRAMMDPRRKLAAPSSEDAQTRASGSLRKRAFARTTAGRWSLLCDPAGSNVSSRPERSGGEKPAFASASSTATARFVGPGHRPRHSGPPNTAASAAEGNHAAAIAAAKSRQAALDAHARILLTRYGVLFRELLARESNAPKWRDLVPTLRRLEARGEIRGGRFVAGAFGEQYALPEAVESLRALRRTLSTRPSDAEPRILTVAAADPLNLAGILVPGERIPAVPGRSVRYANGAVLADDPAQPIAPKRPPRSPRSHSISELLRADANPPRPAATTTLQPGVSLSLFS